MRLAPYQAYAIMGDVGQKNADKKRAADTDLVAFFRFAQKYHQAANELYELHPDDYRGPVSLLYFHTVELALKTFLRSHERQTGKTHGLKKLYDSCRALGLKTSQSDPYELANIAGSLEEANQGSGLRYSPLRGGWRADLSWTREVVGRLMDAVETRMRAIADLDAPPGPVVSFIVALRPVRK